MFVATATPSTWETRSVGVAYRAEVTDDKRLHGFPIVFYTLSEDFGGFRERILPTAVDRTLREALDVRAYFDHQTSKVLGRVRAGTLRLTKEAHGLRMDNDPDTSQQWIRDLMKSIKRGDITGMSFRFRDLTPQELRWNFEDDEVIREVHDMIVGEVSIVSEPAYPSTEVAVRSLETFRQDQAPRRRPSADWYRRWLKATAR